MSWIADRARAFDSSGIRKVFEMAATMKNPINLSIGQPDFDVPAPVKDACVDAIQGGKNAYSVTQGIAPLRERLTSIVRAEYPHPDRSLFITSGTSGGLVLTMMTLVNPGDEVVFLDPYFVMYEPLTKLVGGVPRPVPCYPDFRVDLDRVADAINPKTKLLIVNSPANPTGVMLTEAEVRGLAELAAERNVAIVSDEIYRAFDYDGTFVSPAKFNDRAIVIDGFSKSHAMTGWRVGWVHGPGEVIQEMTKLQQYSFVCAPQPCQWGAVAALDVPMDDYVADYRRKRDLIVEGLKDKYELVVPGGAFYVFPKAPGGNGTQFVERCLKEELLVIPGKIFSGQDTHFRISFAAPDQTIERGIEVLRKLA